VGRQLTRMALAGLEVAVRLTVSKVSAEESILRLLNRGYQLAPEMYGDYVTWRESETFDKEHDVARYRASVNRWLDEIQHALGDIFPTDSEANLVSEMFSVSASSYRNMDDDVGDLVYERIPVYIERLHRVLDTHLRRYSDLPLRERLVVEDVDSFVKVRDVNRSMVADYLRRGRVELTEDEVQMAFEAILDVPFHKKDWGGEVNDLYTANLVLNGARRSRAFLLKGNGLKKAEMTIGDCGKNGDQIVRLFQSPAEVFVIQYVGPIAEAVVHDVHGKTVARRTEGANANYLVIDGQDTARLLYAHDMLPK
jgi:hypothetical protein